MSFYNDDDDDTVYKSDSVTISLSSVTEMRIYSSNWLKLLDCVIVIRRVEFVNVFAQLKGLQGRSDAETRAMLLGVVRHFQTLFDVPNVLGVYARMSAIYRKLSETNTILTTLKDHLELGTRSQQGLL